MKFMQTDLAGLIGQALLNAPALNKDTGFSAKEREIFKLNGLLPFAIESIEQQAERCYQQYQTQPSAFAKYLYLDQLHNHNETLFYYLIRAHLEEMLPIVYTPVIGEAVQKFSTEFRKTRGLFINYPDQNNIESIINKYITDEIDMVVVTDGEGVLGIGDWGAGGMHIAIGKLAVYTLCAGVNPNRVLPIQLDVGTNNESLLKDPMYLGWRHARIQGEAYDNFIDRFVSALIKKRPNIFLHWEDFGRDNARKNLERYQDKICTFNDDMQGTGIVTLSSLLSAMTCLNQTWRDQRIVFFGAGTAATGIADQIIDAMITDGLSKEDAHSRIFMIGRPGLLLKNLSGVTSFQMPYAKDPSEFLSGIGLLDVVKRVHPTILIGCSTSPKAFTEEIIKEMQVYTQHPVILPLSNPTSLCEAIPEDLLRWTNGKALIATGSPFDPVKINNQSVRIAQCNNALAFPGLGLGVMAAKPSRITKGMIHAACQALTRNSPVKPGQIGPLLPTIQDIQKISQEIAKAVIMQANKDGVASVSDIETAIEKTRWTPEYRVL